MKKTIFYVFEVKYNYKFEINHNIEFLQKKFHIKIIDLSKIFTPHQKKNAVRYVKNKDFYVFSKIKDFEKVLLKLKPDYIVLEGGENFKRKINIIIRNLIDTKIVEFFNGSVPEELNYYKVLGIKKALIEFKYFFFIKILKILLNFIYNKLRIFFSLKKKENLYTDILFYAGDNSLKLNKIKNKKIIKKIKSPSFDYCVALRQKNLKNKIINKKYAVFLDSMIMHHDDYNFNYPGLPVTKKYFKEMNKFFSYIEKKFNLEIVIALHPSCFIKNYDKFFNYRKCFKYNTAKLVKDSSYVFSHASSTAANFAIIFKKPLIYLITDEMNKNYLTYTRHEIKKEIFNQNFLNISNLKMNSLPRMFKIDQTRYNNYYKNYINSCKNKNKDLSQVVFERLN